MIIVRTETWQRGNERRMSALGRVLPDQVKQSAGELVGEIWSLARTAAEAFMMALRQVSTDKCDPALAERVRLEGTNTWIATKSKARIGSEIERTVLEEHLPTLLPNI
jgi:hypothetical protein